MFKKKTNNQGCLMIVSDLLRQIRKTKQNH